MKASDETNALIPSMGQNNEYTAGVNVKANHLS